MTKAQLIEQLQKRDATRALGPEPKDSVVGQHSAKTALRDSEERLRAILETAVEAIITIDGRGIIESANRAAESIFGYTAAELIGKNVSILMPAPYREAHDGYLANYLRTGQAKIIGLGREVVGQRKDGSVFPMDLSVSEVRLAGQLLFTGFVRDITEQKRLEREILEISGREQQRIGQDLHDGLCQYLAGIELKCQLLEEKLKEIAPREGASAGEIARHVREAMAQTRSLAHGLSPVELEADGLTSALDELAANVENLFRVKCRFQCQSPILVRNNLAATHLYRIAQEAVNNAVKHGQAGKILITLDSINHHARLSVSDDGRGFPKELKKGKGMGLRIMNYRARMIDATLQVGPGDPHGTVVACTFKKDL